MGALERGEKLIKVRRGIRYRIKLTDGAETNI